MARADNSPLTGEKQVKSGYKNIDPEAGKATRFQPGVSGNPAGPKPGFKHINTIVQELLNDPEFEALLRHPTKGWVEFKGAPVMAVVKAQVLKALDGDTKAYDSLMKSGWSQKIENEHSGETKLIIEKRNYSGNGS
jgi:hypothetical protein